MSGKVSFDSRLSERIRVNLPAAVRNGKKAASRFSFTSSFPRLSIHAVLVYVVISVGN